MSKFNLTTLNEMDGEVVEVSVAGANAPFKAKITEVKEAPTNGDKWESFVVRMDVVDEPPVDPEQGDYDLSHEKFGDEPVTLFSSPNSATELEFVVCRDRNPS